MNRITNAPLRRGHRGERGSTVVMGLIFTFTLLTIGGAVLNYVIQEYRSTQVSAQSAKALAAAEAGLEMAMHIMQATPSAELAVGFHEIYKVKTEDEQIGEGFTGWDMFWDGTRCTKSGAAPKEYALSNDVPGMEGTFTIDGEELNPALGNVRRRFLVTGYYPNREIWQTGKGVRRSVVAWIRRGAWGFPNAAILGKYDVMLGNINSGPITVTYDGSSFTPGAGSLANVVSTGGNVEAHAKSTYVDGEAVAQGTVDPKIVAGAGIAQGADNIEVLKYQSLWPSDATVAAWYADWKSKAQAAGTFASNGAGTGNTLPAGYYEGNLTLANNTGTGTTTIDMTAGKVLFVHGNLLLQSTKLINPGCLVVVTGSVSFQGNGCYTIDGEPYGYGLIALGNIGLQGTPDASGTGSIAVGFIYSVQGSVSLQGDALAVGALIAGGETKGDSVNIQCSSSGGLKYPADLLSKQNFLPGTPIIVAWQEKQ